MRDAPEFFSDSFWEEISELDELGRRAYADYRAARDELFACYGQSEAPNLDALWRRYCESALVLDRTLLETQGFTGPDVEGN